MPLRQGEEWLQGAQLQPLEEDSRMLLPATKHVDTLKMKKEKDGGLVVSDVKSD